MKLKYIFFILIITVSITFIAVCPSYCGMDDRSDRLSNEQSSVFSPGYINATRQKTDAIINQLNPKRSFMDNAMEYINNKLSNEVAEDSHNEVKPELKKKSSAQGDSVKPTAAAVNKEALPATQKTTDADILNNIAKETNEKNGSFTVLKNGNVLIVWTEYDKYYNYYPTGTYFSIKDLSGNTLVEKQQIMPEEGFRISDISNITDLGNGRFAIIISNTKDKSWWINFDSLRVYDSRGVMENDRSYYTRTRYTNGENTWYGEERHNIDSMAYLDDGRFAVALDDGNLSILDSNLQNPVNWQKPDDWYFSYINNVISLGNGKMAIFASDNSQGYYGPFTSMSSGLYVLDSNMNISAQNYYNYSFDADLPGWDSPGYASFIGSQLLSIQSLGSGKFVAAVKNYDIDSDLTSYNGSADFVIKVYDDGLNELKSYTTPEQWNTTRGYFGTGVEVLSKGVTQMKTLEDGSIIVPVIASEAWGGEEQMCLLSGDWPVQRFYAGMMGGGVSTNLWVLNNQGELISNSIEIAGSFSDIAPLGRGDFAVGDNFSQQFAISGSSVDARQPSTITLASSSTNTGSPFQDIRIEPRDIITNYMLSRNNNISENKWDANILGADSLAPIIKELLLNRNDFLSSNTAAGQLLMSQQPGKEAMNQSALSLPVVQMNSREITIITTLANIMKNPTEDQKLILDSAESLLNETKNMENQAGSPELEKAKDDLLQMVAAVLIAQAIPDLFKETDALSIKSIFQELDARKGKIVLGYQESTKPYYDEVIKELSKNIAILQIQNLLSNNLTKEELYKLSRSEIDKILAKLKGATNKTQEAESILKMEEGARIKYLDPNKKLFEEEIRGMMQDFTQRLSRVLEDKGVAKK